MKEILYSVILHEENSTWGYFSPEFGGGGASNLQNAIDNAKTLIRESIKTLRESGDSYPLPTCISDLESNGGWICHIPVEI